MIVQNLFCQAVRGNEIPDPLHGHIFLVCLVLEADLREACRGIIAWTMRSIEKIEAEQTATKKNVKHGPVKKLDMAQLYTLTHSTLSRLGFIDGCIWQG